MKSRFILLIVLIFCSFILSSCLLKKVPSNEYNSIIDKHDGKSKSTIVKEFRDKYEDQCLTKDMMGICFSKIGIVENSHFIAKRRGGVTMYYSYRKKPELFTQGMSDFFIGQDKLRILNTSNKEEAYDIFGYLMRLYELERDNTSVTDNLEAKSKHVDADKEAIYWQSIKDSGNPEYFKAYLQQYPDGTFTSIARIKIQELSEGRTSPISGRKQQ